MENGSFVWLPQGVPPFIHINQNDCPDKKHVKQREEDVAVCECLYNADDPESACGERCLNVLTSTECQSGYCPCGDFCKNQRFQKCKYAKTRLLKTEGRGWGLLADEDIKTGQFVIEYCGEVISSEEAAQRSYAYEAEGLIDAYIISLNANYYIDATRMGSLARFVNHSCQPNCETRKWTVLGETRVGIFAKHDIPAGTELAYDYNFEWYGGVNVRCLCGAPNCSKFLGAKSQGFQEHNHVWEDGDDRYTVDEFPLYDSAEDEPFPSFPKSTTSSIQGPLVTGSGDYSGLMDGSFPFKHHHFESATLNSEALFSSPTKGCGAMSVETDVKEETKLFSDDTQPTFPQTDVMMSDLAIPQNYNMGHGFDSRKISSQHIPNRRSRQSGRKQVNGKCVANLFASKQAREEIIKCEETRSDANLNLEKLYDEIRPAIEEHERDRQDNVSTSVAEKWIMASCSKLKADADLYFSIIKNVMFPVPAASGEPSNPEPCDTDNTANGSTN